MILFEKGWECPKCGAVMSPTTSCCINCRGISEFSVNTNGTQFTIPSIEFPYVPQMDKEKKHTEGEDTEGEYDGN